MDKDNNANMIKKIDFDGAILENKQGKKIASLDSMLESAFEYVRKSLNKRY